MYLGVLPASPWQLQNAWPESPEFTSRAMDPTLYAGLARDCEAAGMDFLFLPDKHVANAAPPGRPDPSMVDSWFEPLTLLSYLAAVTSRIGLVPTLSTTWYEPFPLARQILSLDHLSGGRAGWNAVSSHPGLEQPNFAHRPEDTREGMKARHAEAVSLVKRLWTSWDADAVVADADARRWTRPGTVRPVDHHGEYFDVAGPLTLHRSVQDHPPVVMAGASDGFLRTAARDADVVFTALRDADDARRAVGTLRTFAGEEGRTGQDGPAAHAGLLRLRRRVPRVRLPWRAGPGGTALPHPRHRRACAVRPGRRRAPGAHRRGDGPGRVHPDAPAHPRGPPVPVRRGRAGARVPRRPTVPVGAPHALHVAGEPGDEPGDEHGCDRLAHSTRCRPIGSTSGVPDTGSSMMRECSPNTFSTRASVKISAGAPTASTPPSAIITTWSQ